MVENSVASDFVVGRSGLGDAIIELKGTDVGHAVNQVEATLLMWHQEHLRSGRIAGLIVCAQYPRIDTKIQRMKQRFAKNYQAPLHIVTRNPEVKLERVLSFDGPF